MVDNYPYALASDFAVNRILKEAPESFHKLDNDDVIQVYMDLFGTDPADDMGMNRGGMMNINRMTAPLGYALGGPAGMMEPERKSAQPVTMSQIMRDMEASKSPSGVTHPVQKVISDKTLVDPYSESQGERLKELGSKGLEGIKGLSSKGVNVLRQLLGSKSAEAGVYIPDETLDVMSLDEIVREIELLGPPMFGMSVGPNYVQHLRDLADALEKKIEE